MISQKTHRIDVRLDDEHRQTLDRITSERGITVAEFVREAIEQADRAARAARVQQTLEWFAQQTEGAVADPPWDQVKEQLSSRYDDLARP